MLPAKIFWVHRPPIPLSSKAAIEDIDYEVPEVIFFHQDIDILIFLNLHISAPIAVRAPREVHIFLLLSYSIIDHL